MNLEFSRQIFETSYTKLHENPSSGRGVALCGRTDRLKERHKDKKHTQTDVTKLIVAFRNFFERA